MDWLMPLSRGWFSVRERALALKPCRVAILLVFAGLAFLLLASQGEDVARALAERRTNDVISTQAFWFFVASLAWSLSAWYWARAMLRLKLPGVPEGDGRFQNLRTWTPRLLGTLATLGVAAAFYKASLDYEEGEVKELLEFYARWSAVGAVAFFLAVSVRRDLARALYKVVRLEILNLPRTRDEAYGTQRLRELGLSTRLLLAGVIAIAVALFFVMLLAVQGAAPALGSAAIVLFAAAGWIGAGSALDYLGMRLHLPVFRALLVTAIVFSVWNDNHAVRTLPEAQPAQRPNLRLALRSWLLRHDAALQRGERVPLFVVNAEGGGIRAAYWTVTVLGELHERHPEFAAHVFSLSGVSGGSLGASVFLALLNESRHAKAPFDLKEKGQQILSEDFLSPVVGAMLYPDLVQRILPLSVPALDRAKTLEEAWEHAWEKHVPGRNRLREPFHRLWEDRNAWTPALLLNATWVETGKRIIASNMRVAASRRREDFVDVEDAIAFFAPRSLSLSTAAHMSARFTYVSPAGSLVKDGRTHGRVVDGGYFENSGATTTLAILQTIDELEESDSRWERVDRYVIHISNEPVDARFADDSLARAADNPNIAPSHLLHEAFSPLSALLNTRNARGFYARESAAWAVGHSNYLHFGLCRRSSNAPLGWVLAASTRRGMDAQLLKGPACGLDGAEPIFDNPKHLATIGALLARPASKTGTDPVLPVKQRAPAPRG